MVYHIHRHLHRVENKFAALGYLQHIRMNGWIPVTGEADVPYLADNLVELDQVDMVVCSRLMMGDHEDAINSYQQACFADVCPDAKVAFAYFSEPQSAPIHLPERSSVEFTSWSRAVIFSFTLPFIVSPPTTS